MLSLTAILFSQMLISTGTVSAAITNRLGTDKNLSQDTTNCAASGPSAGEYTVNVCLTHNTNSPMVTGSVLVTATLEGTDTAPRVRSVVFYLDSTYLLTDFEAPYTFELPTDHFVDGTYRLSVEALMRDEFVPDQAVITLNFGNGNAMPPVNTKTFVPSSGRPPEPGEPFIVAVVGDGAGGENDSTQVVDLIAGWNPNLFLYLGDVYGKGTFTEFVNWYGDETRSFGQFRAITNPTVGNHEYESSDEASGYFFYWDNIPHFYSFDAAGWHFINLDSNLQFVQTAPDSPQYEWLLQDLGNNTSQCTIVYFHHPIFSVGRHGDTHSLQDIWALLVQQGVDVVLQGHDHDYQRWHALDHNGRPDPSGTPLFVVGVGGHGIRDFSRSDERIARGYDASSEIPAYGALKLKLNARGLEYHFINVAGAVLDFGVIGCEGPESDTTPPQIPSELTSDINSTGHVTLNWAEVNDDTGVAGYIIYRNGVEFATLDGSTPSYTDTSTQMDTTYTYTLQAFDPAHNLSALSEGVTATTSSTATLTLTPVADAFVDMSMPDTNYGNRSNLRTDTPVQSYLHFDVPALPGAVVSATLRVFANSASSLGHDVYEVSQSDWDESSITYTSAPPLGQIIGSSEPIESDTWVSVDVTALIAGEGQVSLALLTTGTTNVSYSSREGAHPPELIIVLGADTTPDADS